MGYRIGDVATSHPNIRHPSESGFPVVWRQRSVPLLQQILPARRRDLGSAHEHVLRARTEFERIAAPDDDIGDLARVQGAVTVANTEDARRTERHGAPRILPAHAVRDGIAGFLLQVAHVERFAAADPRVANQNDIDAGAPKYRRVLLI